MRNTGLRLTSIESVMPFSHLILCCPLLLLPLIPPSIRLFQWVNSSHEVAKVLEFQLQHHSLQRNPRADLLQNGLVGNTSWNQDCREKYQYPQICRWHHPYGRKWIGTKKPLDESESGEWKSWLKAQHSENKDHGIRSHHFMASRWVNTGNSVRLYFSGLQHHCRW